MLMMVLHVLESPHQMSFSEAINLINDLIKYYLSGVVFEVSERALPHQVNTGTTLPVSYQLPHHKRSLLLAISMDFTISQQL